MNQGALAAQIRSEDERIASIISSMVDSATEAEFMAERAVAEVLGGDCHSAISIFAHVRSEELAVSCRIFEIGGTRSVSCDSSGLSRDAVELGTQVGREALRRGGADILGLSSHIG